MVNIKLDITNFIGKKYGSLTVVSVDPQNNHFNSNKWIFSCDCGNVISHFPSRVLSGHTKSCGCQKGKSALKHGLNSNEFYPTWWGMMRRCYNPENHNYSRYGGRGIAVCSAWHDPAVFIDWARSTIGKKENGISLDRIDNNLGYSPENCRWVSAVQQANNRRSNSLEYLDGEAKTLSEWCKIYGISPETVRARQKRGMSFKDALSSPVLDTRFKSSAPVK